jgi:2-polyprenyl-3-methyl-5-hydroxy-6-metoxy-1,4-benzoquinol methylase
MMNRQDLPVNRRALLPNCRVRKVIGLTPMQNPGNNLEIREAFLKREACPHCGSSSALFRSSSDVNNKSTHEIFHYYRCSKCSLVFMANIPADMAPFYRKGYQPMPSSVAGLRNLAGKEKFRLDELLKLKRGGKLLEIGPWIGIFSINAKDAGFEVEAIENDQACVDFLGSAVGIKAFQSNNPAHMLANMERQYDVIVLWHSLEHLPTPWLVIENASKALKPGGILLIAIPNIDGYDSRVMGDKWLHLDAPRHLYFYPPEALSALCQQFDLLPRYISTNDRLSVILAMDAWYHYARRWLPVKYIRRIVGLTIGRILWWNARSKQMKEGLGSGLTAIFCKSEEGQNVRDNVSSRPEPARPG